MDREKLLKFLTISFVIYLITQISVLSFADEIDNLTISTAEEVPLTFEAIEELEENPSEEITESENPEDNNSEFSEEELPTENTEEITEEELPTENPVPEEIIVEVSQIDYSTYFDDLISKIEENALKTDEIIVKLEENTVKNQEILQELKTFNQNLYILIYIIIPFSFAIIIFSKFCSWFYNTFIGSVMR